MDKVAASRIARTSKNAAWIKRAQAAAERNEARKEAEEEKRKQENQQHGKAS
ncbi:hypothetical protein GGTG_08698 [Gaeumannomyces tritici R3-111a-1]|uniref:Uncharacterized protein n=1 Tax=Gaeumannomyces tritici (strain R3-111a-1) TaxID=644352 RepID=J3P5A9_GAET3|nr:hypothetical protein GGTG_08698 [Gaeumannomyces tritici R3-111a-1]EJT74860.1 hypothetical protein GGTG_08698 [Gaeumannomyces tritici R3-111a-1]